MKTLKQTISQDTVIVPANVSSIHDEVTRAIEYIIDETILVHWALLI